MSRIGGGGYAESRGGGVGDGTGGGRSANGRDGNAAALTGVYVDTYAYGSCVIHHSLAAGTEVFRYSVIG